MEASREGGFAGVPLAAVLLQRVGVRLGPFGRLMVRPLLAGELDDGGPHSSVAVWPAVVQAVGFR